MRCFERCESTVMPPSVSFRESAPFSTPRMSFPRWPANSFQNTTDTPAPATLHVNEQNFAGGGKIEHERESSFLLWNFDVGQDRLKAGHIDAIKELAPTLKARLASDKDAVIDIEGRASATGTKNQALSERRVNAVRDALVKEGIDPAKINVNAVGEFKALPDTSQENLARSRAVRIMIAPRFAPPTPSSTPPSEQFAKCAPALVSDVSMEAGPVTLTLNSDRLTRELQAGTGADQPGMIFTAGATLPKKCKGEIVFVQNVQTFREIVYKDQSRNILETSDWMLDTDDPYPSQSFGTNPQALVQTANDSPSMGFPLFGEPALLTMEIRDDFRMFIMFKPEGKDRKTLQVGRWSFIGQARTDDPVLDNDLSKGSLVLDKGVSRVIPQQGTAVNSTMMPVLSPNITGLKWITNNGGMQTGGKSFADMSLSMLNKPRKKKKS